MPLAARVVLALLCVTFACKSGSGAAEHVLKDTPFVTLGSADFGVHPQRGIEVGARHLLVFFREDAE